MAMITVEMWRRAVGLFGGRSTDDVMKATVSVYLTLGRTSVVASFGFFSLALWTLNIGFNTVNCVIQPHINTLVLANDVHTNPGPSVEEQIASLHDAIYKKFEDLTLEV